MNDRTDRDSLPDRDWGDVWDSLPDAPEWEARAKTAQITLRLPISVLARVKRVAARRSLPYHALARSWIANGIHESTLPATSQASDGPLSGQLNIKLDQFLLDRLKVRAHEQRYPYHRLAREWIESALVQEEANLGIDGAASSRRPVPAGHGELRDP